MFDFILISLFIKLQYKIERAELSPWTLMNLFEQFERQKLILGKVSRENAVTRINATSPRWVSQKN